ncbi:MAG TPA: dihydrofolate reductase family protein [Chloroflexota bacterium]
MDIPPLDTLLDASEGVAAPLPETLERLYGPLIVPGQGAGPWSYGNFVTSLDGVVSLNEQNLAGGGEISGYDQHDQAVMGLLRALADAVVVGAGTLRAVPQHLWTAGYICPPLAEEFARLRSALGKPSQPLNVIVSGRGEVDLRLPVFASGEVDALIVTTGEGAKRLEGRKLPATTKVAAVRTDGEVLAREVMEAIAEVREAKTVLVEGGPHLIGSFFAEELLDDLFLTLSPQVAGRTRESARPGLVEGVLFAPYRPLWAELASVRRGGNHLFLRYRFPRGSNLPTPDPAHMQLRHEG